MKFLTTIVLFYSFFARAQDSLSNWKLMKEYSIEDDAIWNVDILQNVYVVHNRMILKYDSAGVSKFNQSIKSIGQVKEIMPINTMKLILFSEDQQLLCMLDNTLTMSENPVDLADYGIVNASMVTTSSQPDKVWVLDQLNSRLLLLDLSGKMQFQEIRNLKGVLNLSFITSMIELNNHLFMMGDGMLYEFDIYGTLLNTLDFGNDSARELSCLPSGKRFYCLRNDQFVSYDPNIGVEDKVNLPEKQILEFKIMGDIYYFRTADKIFKYEFKNRH